MPMPLQMIVQPSISRGIDVKAVCDMGIACVNDTRSERSCRTLHLVQCQIPGSVDLISTRTVRYKYTTVTLSSVDELS